MRQRRFSVAALAAAVLALVLLLGVLGGTVTIQAQGASNVTFTVEETTFESNYPRGMTFTISASSDAGEITRATLFYELRTGLRERENGEFDSEMGAWVARPYSLRGGLPPWVDFHYYWLLTDSEGNTYETEPQYGIYEDNTREWWHVDTEDITLYWFGDMPELGEHVSETMAAMREYFTEGWGRTLSYKPLAVLFPPGDVWNEYVEGGNNPRAAGFTSRGEGYTVQRIPRLMTPEEHEVARERCGGYFYGSRENTVEEWRLQDMVHTIVHEITHLYQSDFRVSGPTFWIEGEPEFFGNLALDWRSRDAESRMMNYGAMGYPLPTLQGEGPGGGSTRSADGCHALAYAVGETFIRFLVENYGGLETHRLVIENLPGHTVQEAISLVTGVPFVDLENQYRAHYGIAPVDILPTPTPLVIPTASFSFPTPAMSGN